MIYFTGDIHGTVNGIDDFCKRIRPTADDTIVLLGDVGANYYKGRRDKLLKDYLNDLGPKFLCIHGNHEMRPSLLLGYSGTNQCRGHWHYHRTDEYDPAHGGEKRENGACVLMTEASLQILTTIIRSDMVQ